MRYFFEGKVSFDGRECELVFSAENATQEIPLEYPERTSAYIYMSAMCQAAAGGKNVFDKQSYKPVSYWEEIDDHTDNLMKDDLYIGYSFKPVKEDDDSYLENIRIEIKTSELTKLTPINPYDILKRCPGVHNIKDYYPARISIGSGITNKW